MNFKSAIDKLIAQRKVERKANPHAEPRTHVVEVNSDWDVIFCPKTGRYYAMNKASDAFIRSSFACISPAYRIDPVTGDYDLNSMDKNGKPSKFAMKIFTGVKEHILPLAVNEAEALHENQYAEGSLTNHGNPIIVMPYHPGVTICDTAGVPNPALLKLSLKDRLALILQISNQFHEMHAEKIGKKSRIHIDIKGSNIVIDIPDNGPVNARVIDFGSSKVLDDTGQVKTGLGGLTMLAVPREAISEATTKFVTADVNTGFLTSKSDIYSLGAVYAILLGARDPYIHRHESIGDMKLNLQILAGQIEAGFFVSDMLPNEITNLPFEIYSDSQDCAFMNCSNREAPNDRAILDDKKVPMLGYVLYKDQLLYVNKAKDLVSGRQVVSKLREFTQKVAPLKSLPDTLALSTLDLAKCLEINNAHPQAKVAVDHSLRGLIKGFIIDMVDTDHTRRPSMEEVLRFFTLANNIASLATVPKQTMTQAEIAGVERRIQIALLQLHIIYFKGWHLELPLLHPDNKVKSGGGSFAQFDFGLLELEENDELFEQFSNVFSGANLEGLEDGTKPLTKDTFHFLQIKSNEKKLFDAVLAKLEIPAEKPDLKKSDSSGLDKMGELLSQHVHVRSFDDKSEPSEEQARSSSLDNKRELISPTIASHRLDIKVEPTTKQGEQGKQNTLSAKVLPLLSTTSKELFPSKKQQFVAQVNQLFPDLKEPLPRDKKQVVVPAAKQLKIEPTVPTSLPGANPDTKQAVVSVKKQVAKKPSRPPVLSVATKLLSSSKPMMHCLLEEKIRPSFKDDFNLKKEFVERSNFIRADFPEKFKEMKEAMTPQGFRSMEHLVKNVPTIVLFLSHDLHDKQQVDKILKYQFKVERDKPLTPESEAKLFALYQVLLNNKEHILNVASKETWNKLNEILTGLLLHKLQKYIDELDQLKKRNVTYRKWSLGGLFGCKVEDKLKAATEFMQACRTGEQERFLDKLQRDRGFNRMFSTRDNLGKLAQSHLSCMKKTIKFRPL